jgi:hypothetical protein
LAAVFISCSSQPRPYEPDRIDVTLAAPSDRVKRAVTDVLTRGGYDVELDDEQTMSTGYRDEEPSPWDWMLHWRFGTLKSRVEAVVAPETEQTTRLRLHVMSEGKDGLFTAWEDVQSALPQSAENQLRLIKNELKIL